jgi:hypothetical protein
MIRHCRTPCTNGCRGGRATFKTHKYILLCTGERRMLTNLEIVLKNNYAFSNVVDFCEIFA